MDATAKGTDGDREAKSSMDSLLFSRFSRLHFFSLGLVCTGTHPTGTFPSLKESLCAQFWVRCKAKKQQIYK